MFKTSYSLALGFFILTLSLFSCKTETERTFTLESPDKRISLQFFLSEDQLAYYSVKYEDSVVLEPSKLGVIMEDDDFVKNLKVEKISTPTLVEESYEMVQGKRKNRTYRAQEQIVHLSNEAGNKMHVIFRVSDDGVAFRYFFPGSSPSIKKITKEITTFNFPEHARGWLQPMNNAKEGWEKTYPSYEDDYRQDIPVGTPSPQEAGWLYPALFQTGESWALITESALDGTYCATRLAQHSPDGEYAIDFPQLEEVFPEGALNPQSTMPWASPWRVIAIGSLKTIVESTLGTDLANPAIKMDAEYIQPGKASWSWVLLKDDSIVYDVQKRYIDYAAEMNWEYCLIDVNWDQKIGYDGIAELAAYAKTKNVGLILWYNSAGSWNTVTYTPKDKLLTRESRIEEFSKLQAMGIRGIKVDFFGGDGQSVIQYYIDILKDAAEHQLLVNFHGCTLPRGWQRTYPNLMTMEAIKGLEFITFDQGNADREATHASILPFVRNAFDPMDYTPMILDTIPNIIRKTSNGFQLALPVLFLSGIQHFGEGPKGMQKVPEPIKQYLRELPSSWDDTKFIDGFPGKLAIVARRAGNQWYVVGINGENKEKRVNLDLSFIDKKQGTLHTDGEERLSFHSETVALPSNGTYEIEMKPNGGFVMIF